MRYYPVFVDIKDRKVVVVGGGEVAERKVKVLLKCGAKIYLIAKELTDNLHNLVKNNIVSYIGREFEENALEGAVLVIAATNDPGINRLVSLKARARNIFVNTVDQPQDCTFIVPSVINRGDLVIAISTSGKSPALAKRIRKELEKSFDDSYAYLVEVMGKVRRAVLAAGLIQSENRKIFDSILESEILDAIRRMDWEAVGSIIRSKLPPQMKATVEVTDLLPDHKEE